MSSFEFVSHSQFPDDEFIKELVYICLDGKYRVAYVRKQSKSGGLFWTTPMISVTRSGSKDYLPVFLQDSSFLERDIREFLESRAWEQKATTMSASLKDDPFSF